MLQQPVSLLQKKKATNSCVAVLGRAHHVSRAAFCLRLDVGRILRLGRSFSPLDLMFFLSLVRSTKSRYVIRGKGGREAKNRGNTGSVFGADDPG